MYRDIIFYEFFCFFWRKYSFLNSNFLLILVTFCLIRSKKLDKFYCLLCTISTKIAIKGSIYNSGLIHELKQVDELMKFEN